MGRIPGSMMTSSLTGLVLLSMILMCANVVRSESSCKCESVPCEKNMTAADCSTGRVTARPDCPCCFVCAKQLTRCAIPEICLVIRILDSHVARTVYVEPNFLARTIQAVEMTDFVLLVPALIRVEFFRMFARGKI